MATKALKKRSTLPKKRSKLPKKRIKASKKDQNLPRSRWKVPKLEFHKRGMASSVAEGPTISQFQQNFTISANYYNISHVSQYQPNFTAMF